MFAGSDPAGKFRLHVRKVTSSYDDVCYTPCLAAIVTKFSVSVVLVLSVYDKTLEYVKARPHYSVHYSL
jgi:hypothetical protein